MSAGFYNEEGQFGKLTAGFGFTVAISVCLHIVFIALVFLLASERTSRKITAPIYTVDLFAPEKPAVPPKIIKSANQRVSESKSRQIKEEKAIVLKHAPEKEPSVEDALKKIKERVKKREQEEAISKAIEGLQNKQLEKRIKEIRVRVAHKQGVVQRVKPEAKSQEAAQSGAAIKRAEELEERYAQLVGDLIHDKWNYMEDINKRDVVVMNVRIDKTGRLLESRVEESSGNVLLEKSAARAIEKASLLFPPLPSELEKDFVEIGVCFPRCKK